MCSSMHAHHEQAHECAALVRIDVRAAAEGSAVQNAVGPRQGVPQLAGVSKPGSSAQLPGMQRLALLQLRREALLERVARLRQPRFARLVHTQLCERTCSTAAFASARAGSNSRFNTTVHCRTLLTGRKSGQGEFFFFFLAGKAGRRRTRASEAIRGLKHVEDGADDRQRERVDTDAAFGGGVSV
jgi:hypothetical protein